MSATGLTSGPPAGADVPADVTPPTRATGPLTGRVFWPALAAVVVLAVAVVGWFGRRSFPFSDDFVFLLEGRAGTLSWDYLSSPLFGHFSPVSRLVHLGVAALLPSWAGLTTAVLIALGALVVLSVALLMTALFGRSPLALIGTAVAGPTLTLLPLVNWYTAGVNIMPALAGFAVCWAGIVQLVRGRSPWWAALSVAGYLVAVGSWELGIVAPAFVGLWVLLCSSRVTAERLLPLLRRTWWVWAVLAVIGIASVVNYRLGYYVPSPAPGAGLAVEALAVSAFGTLLPLGVGWWDPAAPLPGVVAGAAVLAAVVVVGLLRSGQAWRGWLIALAGWFVPVMALVLSRVGYIGIATVEQPMYFYLPTLVVVVGLLESLAPRPRPSWASRVRPAGRVRSGPAVAVTAVVVLALIAGAVGYARNAWTVITATNYGMIGAQDAPERTYVATAVASLRDRQQPFTVLDQQVPGGVTTFPGHNRLSQIIGLYAPDVSFNAPTGPYLEANITGALRPAQLQTRASVDLTDPGAGASVTVTGAQSTRVDPAGGLCLRTGGGPAQVQWALAEPIAGKRLAVRLQGQTPVATDLTVQGVSGTPLADAQGVLSPEFPADVNPRPWTPGQTARLDTLSALDFQNAPTLTGVILMGFAPNSETCIAALEVDAVVV